MASEIRTTSIKEKLDILKETAPHICRSLIPSKIVPKLGILLSGDERREILEIEDAGNRMEAAKKLLDIIVREGERGMNYFLDVLREEDTDPGWQNILQPLENITGLGANECAKIYYEFILHLLEGQIIDRLSEEVLQTIVIHLYSSNVFDEYERERIEARLQNKGRHNGAIMMFTLLGMRDPEWPVKFFIALREVHPEVYQKIVPYEPNPVFKESSINSADDNSTNNNTADSANSATASSLAAERAAEDDQEQTVPKQQAACQETPDTQQMAQSSEEGEGNCREEDAEARRQSVRDVSHSEDDLHNRAAAVAMAAVADETDDAGAHFSDDEKQDTEESEKDHHDKVPGPVLPKDLKLRNYQHELSRAALNGTNTIICAPTGSGKTRVALHIVQRHLEDGPEGQVRKVVFLARTVPLVSQQHRNFREFLPKYKCELVTGESENSMTVHHQLADTDILVLTPKILENHLVPDKIPSLARFSLIILDECHHTRKGEPYMSVMKHFLRSKKQGEQGLPQIVGLTASIGVEKATTADEARESILGIMGNLDVCLISQVRENLEELRETVPRPEEDLETLCCRENDEISNTISNVMEKIVEELLQRGERMRADNGVDEIRRLLTKRETDLKSQKFGQWAVNLRNQARLLMHPANPKDEREVEKIFRRQSFSWDVQLLAEWLVKYNEAFDVHDLTCPEDVLDYLNRKSALMREENKQFISTELDQKLLGYFRDVERQLNRFKGQKNPNLVKLGEAILSHISAAGNDSDGFRILVFVRTRATSQALCRWLNSHADEQLRKLNAQHFTGTGAHQEQGGMTAYEQEETLKHFQSGQVRLLVTTSVGEEGIDIAECNLTIRYNHVGNEVTTVQTRGRSRKRGGRSILMAMPKIIEQEQLNRKREQLMHDALELIQNMPEQEIREVVDKVQTKVLEVEEIDQIMKQVKQLKKEAPFSIACPQCYKVKVNGSQIRCINNAHRVIIGHDIDKDVVILPGRTILKKDDWEMRGSVNCKCKKQLGQLLTYKKANFILVSPKYWVFLDKAGTPTAYKKWTQVPHHIAEVSPADIKKHLGQDDDDDDDNADEEQGATAGNV